MNGDQYGLIFARRNIEAFPHNQRLRIRTPWVVWFAVGPGDYISYNSVAQIISLDDCIAIYSSQFGKKDPHIHEVLPGHDNYLGGFVLSLGKGEVHLSRQRLLELRVFEYLLQRRNYTDSIAHPLSPCSVDDKGQKGRTHQSETSFIHSSSPPFLESSNSHPDRIRRVCKSVPTAWGVVE
ncbi:MAG: hypothetical protein DRP94_08340 [Candidatus Latescibacterota bacterium]|nr:MAG: hypothetical protein DRP94_08340 [Candidatus Latescibacterota bacterium]